MNDPLSILLVAILIVESGTSTGLSAGGATLIGDGGRSVGPYQISADYWRDGCEALGVDWPLSARADLERSRQVVIAYLDRWGRDYARRTGRPLTLEVAARLHNSGPWTGRWPTATDRYWAKVRAEIRRIQTRKAA